MPRDDVELETAYLATGNELLEQLDARDREVAKLIEDLCPKQKKVVRKFARIYGEVYLGFLVRLVRTVATTQDIGQGIYRFAEAVDYLYMKRKAEEDIKKRSKGSSWLSTLNSPSKEVVNLINYQKKTVRRMRSGGQG